MSMILSSKLPFCTSIDSASLSQISPDVCTSVFLCVYCIPAPDLSIVCIYGKLYLALWTHQQALARWGAAIDSA